MIILAITVLNFMIAIATYLIDDATIKYQNRRGKTIDMIGLSR